MTTPTPMARALEAVRVALRHQQFRSCCRDSHLCDRCCDRVIRAVLPALLEAVVGKMQGGDDNVRLFSTEDDPVRVSRAELLAALTTAAGRLP